MLCQTKVSHLLHSKRQLPQTIKHLELHWIRTVERLLASHISEISHNPQQYFGDRVKSVEFPRSKRLYFENYEAAQQEQTQYEARKREQSAKQSRRQDPMLCLITRRLLRTRGCHVSRPSTKKYRRVPPPHSLPANISKNSCLKWMRFARTHISDTSQTRSRPKRPGRCVLDENQFLDGEWFNYVDKRDKCVGLSARQQVLADDC